MRAVWTTSCSRRACADQPSRRQIVSHNHVLVNGRRANIPSMVLPAGDVVTIKERSTWIKQLNEEVPTPTRHADPGPGRQRRLPNKITFVREPQTEEVCLDVDPIAVVERYSGRLTPLERLRAEGLAPAAGLLHFGDRRFEARDKRGRNLRTLSSHCPKPSRYWHFKAERPRSFQACILLIY